MDVNAIITEIAESGREATNDEIQHIREHVAGVGYEPGGWTKAGTSIDCLFWQGQIIRGNDWMENSVAHYLRHAVARREWPTTTTFDTYITSLRKVVEDPWDGYANSPTRSGRPLAKNCQYALIDICKLAPNWEDQEYLTAKLSWSYEWSDYMYQFDVLHQTYRAGGMNEDQQTRFLTLRRDLESSASLIESLGLKRPPVLSRA